MKYSIMGGKGFWESFIAHAEKARDGELCEITCGDELGPNLKIILIPAPHHDYEFAILPQVEENDQHRFERDQWAEFIEREDERAVAG